MVTLGRGLWRLAQGGFGTGWVLKTGFEGISHARYRVRRCVQDAGVCTGSEMPSLPLTNLLIAHLLHPPFPNPYREASLIGDAHTTSTRNISTRMLVKPRVRLARRRLYRSRLTELCIKRRCKNDLIKGLSCSALTLHSIKFLGFTAGSCRAGMAFWDRERFAGGLFVKGPSSWPFWMTRGLGQWCADLSTGLFEKASPHTQSATRVYR